MPDYKHHVFLSYARPDTQIMQPVRDYLRASGLTVWTDEGIEPGTSEWVSAIQNAIKASGCMIIVLSPSAYKSTWVEREIAFAEEHKLRRIPLHVSGETTEAIPIRLISHQRIDARQDLDGEVRKLVDTVRKHLSLPQPLQNEGEYRIVIPSEEILPVEKFGDFDHLHKEQKRILFFMNEYIVNNNLSPTNRDVMNGLKISSESVVAHHWEKLIEEGFLEKEGKVARGIRVVRPIPKHNVFLSFSLADQELARQMNDMLTSRGLNVCSTEFMQPSTRLSLIQDEIRNSYCMIILLSPYSKYSIKILSHLICAQEVQTTLIPLLVSGNPVDSIPSILPEKYFDLREVLQTKLDKIYETIVRLSGKLL